jgi:hypothetical protein
LQELFHLADEKNLGHKRVGLLLVAPLGPAGIGLSRLIKIYHVRFSFAKAFLTTVE